jgi:hypothetical protein
MLTQKYISLRVKYILARGSAPGICDSKKCDNPEEAE